jgi:long-chain acyl-CoA synthetase
VKKWTSENGNNSHITIPYESSTELKQIVLDDMTREGKKSGLMSYEQVKIIEFVKEPFTVENGLLTPTFKARRYAIEKKYKELFQKIYKNAKD